MSDRSTLNVDPEAQPPIDENEALPLLKLQTTNYLGGIAAWPAVQSIYDSRPTTSRYEGVHVHAYNESGEKVLDCTTKRLLIDDAEVKPEGALDVDAVIENIGFYADVEEQECIAGTALGYAFEQGWNAALIEVRARLKRAVASLEGLP